MDHEGEDAGASGEITSLETAEQNYNRVRVFLDGEFALEIHREVALHENLQIGSYLDLESRSAVLASEHRYAAREVALRYLEYGPRTSKEVYRRVHRAGFTASVAEETVGAMKAQGFVDDAEYAMEYVSARFKNRGFGPRRLRADLRARGVAKEHIDAALNMLSQKVDYKEAARKHAERHWPRLQGTTQARRRKLIDYLFRRGFSREVALEILNTLAKS